MENHSSDNERTMWVGNIDNRVTEEVLWELFLQAGPLESVKIPKDYKTGRQKNFGFVKFEHGISVMYVIHLMDGICLYGAPLSLNFKHKPGSKGSEGSEDETNSTPTPKRRRINTENEQYCRQAQVDWTTHAGSHPSFTSPFTMRPATVVTQYPFQATQHLRWMQRPFYHAPQRRQFEEEAWFRPHSSWECSGDDSSPQILHSRRKQLHMQHSYPSPLNIHEEGYSNSSGQRNHSLHSRRGNGRR